MMRERIPRRHKFTIVLCEMHRGVVFVCNSMREASQYLPGAQLPQPAERKVLAALSAMAAGSGRSPLGPGGGAGADRISEH